MAYNKVVIRNGEEEQVVIDVSGTTVTAADLPKGKTALDKTGAVVTGTTPDIHYRKGTFELPHTTENGTISYVIRDDVVNVVGANIKSDGETATVNLPEDMRPGHTVFGAAYAIDQEGNAYANRVYVVIGTGLQVGGVQEGDQISFCLSYLIGG